MNAPREGTPRVVVRGLAKAFGATQALGGVDLSAQAGEIHAVLGENGAGKSTLMKVLAGLVVPDAGGMTLDGVPFRPRNPAAARAKGVVLVSQELSLCPHLTVGENVLLGREPTASGLLAWRRLHEEAAAALADVTGDEGPIDPRKPLGELSLPDQQLVEIARALAQRGGCRVLILDEPTSSLGQRDAARLFARVRELSAKGTTVLYISHFLEEVTALATGYTVLRDGRSVDAGSLTPGDKACLPHLVATMAGRAAVDQGSPATGTAIAPAASIPAGSPGDVVLELDAVAGRSKLTRASLSLRRGEILGIAGLVGAGRTELLRVVAGLDPLTSGRVTVKGDPTLRDTRGRLAQGVGLLSEDRRGEGLLLPMSIADNVTLSTLRPWVSPAHQQAVARGYVERLAIRCHDVVQPVGELSGGNQQKVAIARLLRHGVDVLLLDEPTRGVDVGAKAQIFELVQRLAAEGKAVLLVSSYLPELLTVAHRVAVMHKGHLGASRPTAAWTEHSLLEAATGAATS